MVCSNFAPTSAPVVNHNEELCDQIRQALRTTGYHSLRLLRVETASGCVALSGRVSSYYLKQMAQSAAMSVAGARRVVNEVEVQ